MSYIRHCANKIQIHVVYDRKLVSHIDHEEISSVYIFSIILQLNFSLIKHFFFLFSLISVVDIFIKNMIGVWQF